MANSYSVTIRNQSGRQQRYAFFAEAPKVTGNMQGKIWQNVLASNGAANNQVLTVQMSQQYFAMCGSSYGSPADGVAVSVSGMSPVALGGKNPDGSITPGTNLPYIVIDQVPQFGAELEKGAYANSYQISTNNSFTPRDALSNNYVIGLGGSCNGRTGPTASFIPEPNVRYQVQPSNTYYVTFGDYTMGNIIDFDRVDQFCKIDFTALPTNSVTIVHDESGILTLQKR